MTRFLGWIILCGLAVGQTSQNATTPSPEPSGQAPFVQETVSPELLPAVPPIPKGKVTLVGGTITRIDRVKDQFTLRPFGAGSMRVVFDGRTGIFQNGEKATSQVLREGSRVYVDTQLDGSTIFARNIRVQ